MRRPLKLSNRPARTPAASWRLAATCAALLWLAGCGVGVGGTGTGEDLEPFGASAASVCGATIAPALACPTTGTPAAEKGTALRLFVDAEHGGRVVARFDGNRIELEARCLDQSFTGTWGVGQDAMARYFGNATLATERSPVLAVMRVSLLTNGTSQLVVELVSTRGQVLLPSTRLSAVERLPSPLPACR